MSRQISLKNSYSRLRESVKQQSLPFLLVIVMTMAVLNVFGYGMGLNTATVCVVLMLIPVFAVCRVAEKHRVIGTIVILLFLAASLTLLLTQLARGWQDTHVFFQQWLLTAGSEAEGDGRAYLYALAFGCVVFLGMTVYYFSIVLYRTSFLMLLSLLPCVLYAKVINDMDNLYLVLIATLNVAVFLMNRAKKREDAQQSGRFSMILSAGIFIFTLFLLCAAIPKKEDARYYDRFEDLFLGGNTRTEVSEDFSGLGAFSGNADNFLQMSSRRLYTITGDINTYFKRQNFDYYDFKKDRWYADSEMADAEIAPEKWERKHLNLSLGDLQNAVRHAENLSPGFAAAYGCEGLVTGERITDVLHHAQIQSLNFKAAYYLVPTRVVSVTTTDIAPYAAAYGGAFYRESGMHPADYQYDVAFYDDSTARNKLLQMDCCNLNYDTATEMLAELYSVLKQNDDPYAQCAKDWYQQHLEAEIYRMRCEENNALISNELRELAEQLTAGLDYEWEKAYVLQAYFQSDDFTYDISYKAADNSPEYFVFHSKTGTCSDYASAYVLLARAAGLTVRYAEGYVPEYASVDQTYYVKNTSSHAYPEVFLPGMGWMIFEPTSARVIPYQGENDTGILAMLRSMKVDFGLMRTIALLGACAVLAIIIFKLFLPLLEEIVFRVKLLFLSAEKTLPAVYQRLVRKAGRKAVPGAECLTPAEFGRAFTDREPDMEIASLVEPLQAYVYGGILPAAADKKKAISIYRCASGRLLLRILKRRKK